MIFTLAVFHINFYRIVHLSLRFCDIIDKGAERLAYALGNMLKRNCKLLTLNLSGNRIGDDGAKFFAIVKTNLFIIFN